MVDIDFTYVFYCGTPDEKEALGEIQRGNNHFAVTFDDNTLLNYLIDEIVKQHSANLMTTEIFKLKERKNLAIRAVTGLLNKNDFDVTKIADDLAGSMPLNEALGSDRARSTFIVFCPPAPIAVTPNDNEEDRETYGEDDAVTELNQRFQKFITATAKGPTPSVSAKSAEYSKNQGFNARAILDGRSRAGNPATTAPPIELYHPVFSRYIHNCKDCTVPKEYLRQTSDLMRTLSVIATRESGRDAESRRILKDLLDAQLETVPNQDRTSSDFCHLSETLFNIGAASLITEVKGELGSGGSDPSVQSSFSFTRFWVHPERKPILDACCCPSFLVGLAGPWIVILGAVITTQSIVQRLTPYLWLACSRALDDQQVLDLARPLYALKLALADLKSYYADLKPVPWTENIHPRFCPYITEYPSKNGPISFRYVRPLERDATCVTFEVEIDGQPAVVKFVQQYGKDAHNYMAKMGYAPNLRYYGKLGDGFGDMGMVVMDWVKGKTLFALYGSESKCVPVDIKEKVRLALKELNDHGFIFGDLRQPNIMVKEDDQSIQLIDFDWAGTPGEMRYPFHVSSVIRDAAGAQEYDLISQHHQDAMFRCL